MKAAMLVWEAGAVIDVRLLGPLVLIARGKPVPLGPQQRVLLLALLLAAGNQVPSARLAELLWEGARERSPATLRSHIAHLRQALYGKSGEQRPGDGQTQPSGPAPRLLTDRLGGEAAYSLHLDREQVDVARFGRLVAAGRDQLGKRRFAEASKSLTDALALWRGQPLADVANRSFAAGEVRRLKALHRAAWSARLEADVGLGLHGEVIGELEAMLARWPDDEGLRQLLVVCLHRAGRTAEAARACREGIAIALEQGLDVTGLHMLQRDLLRSAQPRISAQRLSL
jgi:DNA-binding SARP family transcriptional activator